MSISYFFLCSTILLVAEVAKILLSDYYDLHVRLFSIVNVYTESKVLNERIQDLYFIAFFKSSSCLNDDPSG